MKQYLIMITIIISSYSLGAQSFYGLCVAVHDGDTISVLKLDKASGSPIEGENKPVTVQIDGLDAPELNQPYGKKAKSYLSQLILGKYVRVQIKILYKEGRILAWVIAQERGIGDVSFNILRAGLAWQDKINNFDDVLKDEENKARKLKVGLWQDKKPTPPWIYRKKNHIIKNNVHELKPFLFKNLSSQNDYHHHQAGNFNEAGWCEATSTKGRFSILVPGLYDDYTRIENGKKRSKMDIYALEGRSNKTIVGFGIYMIKGPNKRKIKNFQKDLKRALKDEGINMRPSVIKHLNLKGAEGFKINGLITNYFLMFMYQNDIYLITVSGLSNISPSVADIVHKILNSLRISKQDN